MNLKKMNEMKTWRDFYIEHKIHEMALDELLNELIYESRNLEISTGTEFGRSIWETEYVKYHIIQNYKKV